MIRHASVTARNLTARTMPDQARNAQWSEWPGDAVRCKGAGHALAPLVGRGRGGVSRAALRSTPFTQTLSAQGGEVRARPLMSPLSARLRALYDPAGARFVELPVLHPADPFLETAGEDIRRRMFVTEGPHGRAAGAPAGLHHPRLPDASRRATPARRATPMRAWSSAVTTGLAGAAGDRLRGFRATATGSRPTRRRWRSRSPARRGRGAGR